MELVLATGNQGKVKELTSLLSDLKIKVLSLKDFPEVGEIIEDGSTFKENAVKKAQTVAKITGKLAIADDSGLEVDYLNGAPGIYSARFAGEEKDDMANNRKLLELLKGVPDSQRTARFRCVIAISFPNGDTYTTDGVCEGIVGHTLKGNGGFGYDPLFLLPQYGKTFAEIEPETKNQISHRGRALAKAKTVLIELVEKKQ